MRSVIIADDEKWIVEGIKAGVNWKKYGFEVIDDAENGQEALQLIQSLRPTLVLTDIKMPVMNGLELIQRGKVSRLIRSLSYSADMPSSLMHKKQ